MGDELVSIGEQGDFKISASGIAKNYETVNYDIVTVLTNRVERVYLAGKNIRSVI